MKKWKYIISAYALLLPTASMADVNCKFSIKSMNLTGDGWVSANFGGDGFQKSWWLCTTGGTITVNDGYGTRNVPADVCRTLFSEMLTLKTTGKPIYLLFNGPSACTAAALPAEGTMTLFPASFGMIE